LRLNQLVMPLPKLTGEAADPINPIIPYTINKCQIGGRTVESVNKQIAIAVRPKGATLLTPMRSTTEPKIGNAMHEPTFRKERQSEIVPRSEEKAFANGFTNTPNGNTATEPMASINPNIERLTIHQP